VRQYSVGDYIFTLVGFIGIAVPNFLLALVLMYLTFKYFDVSVGGLFSAEFALAPWSWAKFVDLMQHLPLPADPRLVGTAQLIRHHARQPARRAPPPLRRHRPRQGAVGDARRS
jgi:peptide/nickel transport system permease protein